MVVPKNMKPAGAYVEDAVAYYLSRYEKATVLALADGLVSLALAMYSFAALSRTRGLQGALCYIVCLLNMYGQDADVACGARGFEVRYKAVALLRKFSWRLVLRRSIRLEWAPAARKCG